MKNHMTSEEKHYKKLNLDLRQEKNRYLDLFQTERKLNTGYVKIINKQNEQIERLELENEKLKSVVGLSDEEVKELVKAATKVNALSNLAKTMFSKTFGIQQ